MLEKRELDKDAVAFVRVSLSRGAAFSRLLLDLPLEEGRVFTFLPRHVDEAVAKSFDLGGIFKKEESVEVELRIAEVVSSYLSQSVYAYGIFENPVMRPTDPSAKRSELSYFTFDEGVYFFLSPGQTELDEVIATVRGVHSWVFNGALTASRSLNTIDARQRLNRVALVELATNADHILVGAYDHEGYLIWSRR